MSSSIQRQAPTRTCDSTIGGELIHVAPLRLTEHRAMPNNSNPLGSLPETGYVRQSQLIPGIFPFSSANSLAEGKGGHIPPACEARSPDNSLEGPGYSQPD